MKLSVIVNTSALGPHAHESRGSDSALGSPHAWRAYALRNLILPAYANDPNVAELIVVGEWEPGPYLYIHEPSRYLSSVDALAQRQRGFDAATGDYVAHVHDDHLLQIPWVPSFHGAVMVPERRTRLRASSGEPLPNGGSDYVSGHAALYRRDVLERCPWGAVKPVRTWDIEHTQAMRTAGFDPRPTSAFIAWDCEFGGMPWR